MSDQLARYHRQMLLPGFGAEGQRRLLDSTVVVLGCGALGSVAADLLARAGVGHLVIVDRDVVELTNLQRQVLFDERDVAEGLPKAEAAKRHIAQINSGIRVTAIVDDINHGNIAGLAEGADLLLDGLDNFETRYLANDLAVQRGIPWVYGAAIGTTGMAFPVLPHGDGASPWEAAPGGNLATPCFRCLFEEAPPPGSNPTCDTVGVIGPVVALIASHQAAEATKILAGHYDRVSRQLLRIDLWADEYLQLPTAGAWDQGNCPCCRQRRFDYLEGRAGSSAAVLCGRNAVQLRDRQPAEDSNLPALAERLRAHGEVRVNDFLLCAVITEGNKRYEITLFPNGRAIVKGTDEPEVARAVYAKYVGV